MWRRGDDLARPARPARRRAVSNASCARSSAASPRARWPKRKFSPTDTRCAPSRSTSTWSMNSCARLGGERAVERDHDELARRRAPAIRSALAVERGQQLRRGVGRDHRARVRLEGQHGVGAADHLAVAEVHAVELAHRELARPVLRVGEPGDVHQPRKPTTGLACRPRAARRGRSGRRRRAAARRCPSGRAVDGARRAAAPARPSSPRQLDRRQEAERVVERRRAARGRRRRRRTAPIRGAPQLEAVGVAEVGDQRAHVGAGRALDRERRPGRRRATAARSACTSTSRSGELDDLAAARQRVRALARRS